MLYTEDKEEIIEFKDIKQNIESIASDITNNGVKYSRRHYYYKNFITMDIETSTVKCPQKADLDHKENFAYSIAVYTGNHCILCRTWREYNQFIDWLTELVYPTYQYRIVCYIHNLPYEFQYIRNFMYIDEVFATQPRKVVKCLGNNIEYRCSYKLTNMGLDRFLKSVPSEYVKHFKQDGEEFDYSKLRTPSTPLTPKELQYIYNDVAGLHEGITYKLDSEEDDITTIPLTSTGYVRRNLRAKMNTTENHQDFVRMQLDQELYGLMREARRGGNCHCVPVYSNQILENMKSKDMSSGYPAVMVQCKFPMTKFLPVRSTEQFEKFVYDDEHACLIDLTFYNINIKTLQTIAYISRDICTQLFQISTDNGRILSAEKLSLVMTDLDYKIIKEQYEWEDVKCNSCFCARYDYLPEELRDELLEQYKDKTTLKDKDYYYYMKRKNEFNANFGCMLTDICQENVIYNAYSDKKPFEYEQNDDYSLMLTKYYTNPQSFLSYQHGIWVTAWCRWRLQKAINLLKNRMVYCDTDSVKYISSVDQTDIAIQLNAEIDEEIKQCGKNCTVIYKGKAYTLGHWEDDGDYAQFKSMGAKKYCSVDQTGHFTVTVSGLSKSKSLPWFEQNGTINAFKEGTIIPPKYSGRTTSKFNDRTKPITIKVKGEEIEVGSNIVIENVTYEFGLTEDYRTLILTIQDGGIL